MVSIASGQYSDIGGEAHGAFLPDPSLLAGPFRPFRTDPGWDEAWWWLAIPAALAAALVAVYQISPPFYRAWILPEGYGFLKVGHFLIPLAAMIIALRLLTRKYVRERGLLCAFLILSALACLYIAGEEMSWGQHFFNWQTPDYWVELNRQQETNLHNTSEWLNHKPRILLEIGVLIGGLFVPLAASIKPGVRRNRWSLFLPANAMVPVTLGALLFKGFTIVENVVHIRMLLERPAEPTESFLYLFILFYLIVLTRRVGELEREQKGRA